MIKCLGILIGGIFVGAVGIEIINRKYPDFLHNVPDTLGKVPDALGKLSAKTCDMASGIKEAFKRGYENASHPEAVQAGA